MGWMDGWMDVKRLEVPQKRDNLTLGLGAWGLACARSLVTSQ